MNMKILVVDDDQMNIMRAKMILSKGGYEILTAESGETALESVAKNCPDLILLDIEMPGMSGIETLKKLRATENGAALPVMFMTGTYEAEQEEQGKMLGVLDCVKKPFLPAVILEQVNSILN